VSFGGLGLGRRRRAARAEFAATFAGWPRPSGEAPIAVPGRVINFVLGPA